MNLFVVLGLARANQNEVRSERARVESQLKVQILREFNFASESYPPRVSSAGSAFPLQNFGTSKWTPLPCGGLRLSAAMREISIATYCNTSAAKFWSLRQDRGYDEWFAGLDGQVCHTHSLPPQSADPDGASSR